MVEALRIWREAVIATSHTFDLDLIRDQIPPDFEAEECVLIHNKKVIRAG